MRAAKEASDEAKKASEAAKKALKEASKASVDSRSASPSATGGGVICGQPVIERTGTYNASWRPKAGSDYVVIGYDVQQHSVQWFDYKHQGMNPIFVDRNGSLVPVVYSREKVLVHVCGLHPTDSVGITTNDVSVPEQGADIRGTTPSTAPAIAPTLDTLGSANAAGTAFGPAGVSFGLPPGVTSLQTSLFTAGSSKDGTTYSDATLNIAPEDLALETLALFFNAQDALKTIDELAIGFNTSVNPEPAHIPNCDGNESPGTICALSIFASKLEGDLDIEKKGVADAEYNYRNYANAGADSLSAFNYFLARTQTLVSEMNGLAAGVGQAGLPPRAIALRQNLEAILGVFEQVEHLIEDDKKFSNNPVLNPTDASSKKPPTQAYYDNNSNGTSIMQPASCDNLRTAIASGETLYKDQGKVTTYTPSDTVTCHAMELYMMESFERRFQESLRKYGKFATETSSLLIEVNRLKGSPQAGTSKPLAAAAANAQNLGAADLQLNQAVTESKSLNDNLITAAKDATSSLITAKSSSKQDLAAFAVQLKTGAALASSESQILSTLKQANSNTSQSSSNPLPEFSVEAARQTVDDLFTKILAMRAALGALDSTVGQIFAEMNDRYEDTFVEQTDALPPLTSNTNVRIGISVQRNYTPFTLSGGATIGSASPTSTQSAASNQGGGTPAGAKGVPTGNAQGSSQPASSNSPSSTISASGSNDVTLLMEVHRLANFNLVGGAMAIHVPTFSISPVPEYGPYGVPTITTTTSGMTTTTTYTYSAVGTCNGGTMPMLVSTTSNTTGVTPAPALYYCYKTSQTSSWQPAGMAGMAWFPLHRDYYSRGRGAAFMSKNLVPSILLASSITSLGSAFIGPNFEPVNGLDIFAGYASAHQTSLPSGVSQYTVYPPAGSSTTPPTLNTATHLKGGFTYGIGFDLSVFLQLFGKTQGPSLP